MRVKIFTSSPGLDIKRFIRTIDGNDFVIATDRMALELVNEDIRVDLAIGDFDSVNEEEVSRIRNHSSNTTVLPRQKDVTDAKAAFDYAKTLGAKEIIIYAKASGRFDHFYANLALLEENVSIVNTTNKLYTLVPGTHNINPVHTYVSFYAIDNVDNLNLNGFKYELKAYNLTPSDPIGTSNEGNGVVSFTSGRILVIESSDSHE